jgi:hypothetical protein
MSERPCGRSPGAVVLGMLLVLIWSGSGPAHGQVNPDDPSEETPSNPAEELPGVESEPETPASPSEKESKRRAFKRIGPQPMTPEQREDAERLRKVAAKYGTDPTAIVGRIQLTSQYLDLTQGANATVSTVRVDLPFRNDFLLRTDMPFLRTNDPNNPGMSGHRGVSDLAVTAGWRAYNTPGPAIATARFLPRLESFLIGLLAYQTSVGGDPSRKDVSLFNVTAQVNSFWGQRWWTIVQSVWQVDFERSGKSSMVLEFEGGRNLIGRFGAYVRPGIGIWGRDVAGAYQWNIEVGVRYMFASF